MKQIRWRVRWGKGQEKTFRHFHDAYRLAEELRAAGQKAEISSTEEYE